MNYRFVGLAALLALPLVANAQNYTLTDLGPGTGYGINNAGQVVGTGGSSYGFATIWTNGVASNLWGPSDGSIAFAINNNGVAVGSASGSGQNSAESTSGFLMGVDGGAFAINDKGTIVGASSQMGTSPFASMWSGCNGGSCALTQLGTLAGTSSSFAAGINNAGLIVGSSEFQSGSYVATIWNGTTATALGTLAGRPNSEAQGINSAGTVVGFSYVPNPNVDTGLATVWRGVNVTALKLLPGATWSEALAINDAGVIVGQSGNASLSGGAYATLWERGDAVDLNAQFSSLLPPGFMLIDATAINAGGQIVANAYDSQTNASLVYLLTPTRAPEIDPASATSGLTLLLGGLTVLRGRRKLS